MIAMDLNAVIILFFAIIAAVVVANSLIRERVSLWRFIRRGIVGEKTRPKRHCAGKGTS